MPGIICNFCQADVGRGLENLSNHLHYQHNFLLSKKGRYKCGQGDCLAEFQLFSSLRKHLRRVHPDVAFHSEASDGEAGDDGGVDDNNQELQDLNPKQ